ncbi:5'-3' exonuclease H3TH domain-containing protein [Mycoplasma sp. Mirounga ES2805-ORL]|uniref:5'-3' exonuclease n=1 Tax=Mycoplasma sp. Mirounga ES2805-ORL TaxID=754514 RepID=UPI00197C196A|nr:5'-3' exonuclease H3TH domain-containing protein [Mycoplasma sp. Mirounga ES2805-ORL]QSF13969.1 5'-3' exonuclease [Mycoplasma sp. Mirounga ES2805-ORL]
MNSNDRSVDEIDFQLGFDRKRFLLIDGNFLMFQSFYASSYSGQPLMTNNEGTPVNGVHVFLMTLHKLISITNPNYIFIAFDAFGKTKRHNEYEDYKAGRTKAPEIIFPQFALIKEILTKMNIPWKEKLGDEADDLIATLAYKTNECNNIIFSKDKDLLQLVSGNTFVLRKRKANSTSYFDLISSNNFLDEYELNPSQIADYKGIAGDPSDNLKGIQGIGHKTAIKLLQKYGSLESIFNNINEIKGKTKDKLLEGREHGELCKKLAILNTNVDMDLNIDLYKLNINKESLKEIFDKHSLASTKEKFLKL